MEHRLDVSMLEPCEPMERTLEGSAALGAGDYLRVIHRREPRLLYPILQQQGYAWATHQCGPGNYEVFIWRAGDAAAQADAQRNMPGHGTPC